MPRTWSALAVLLAVLAGLVAALAAPPTHDPTASKSIAPTADPVQHKRQIFREQVNPHTGGKIPEDAFRADRLALNRLNSAGISVPDGVQLSYRGSHKPPEHDHSPEGHSHSHDPHATLIKIVQTEDGRYVPPEGTAHRQQPNTVDSTYLLRTPAGWNQHAAHLVSLQRPLGPPLQLSGGGSLRRPFRPQAPPPPPPPPPQHPSPPPRPQQHHQQHDDGDLTPFPSPALQPPPNVPPPSLHLYHHKPLVHPLEVPHPPHAPPPPPPPQPSVSPTPPRKYRPPLQLARHHFPAVFQQVQQQHSSLSVSPLIDIEARRPEHRDLFSSNFHHSSLSEVSDLADLPESSHNEASLVNTGLLTDSFLLEDWPSDIPGGLLSPEQLAALYNSDHEERLQHLHALASF